MYLGVFVHGMGKVCASQFPESLRVRSHPASACKEPCSQSTKPQTTLAAEQSITQHIYWQLPHIVQHPTPTTTTKKCIYISCEKQQPNKDHKTSRGQRACGALYLDLSMQGCVCVYMHMNACVYVRACVHLGRARTRTCAELRNSWYVRQSSSKDGRADASCGPRHLSSRYPKDGRTGRYTPAH